MINMKANTILKSKKSVITIICFVLIFAQSLTQSFTYAQKPLALSEAIDRALKSRLDVKIQQGNAAISANEIAKLKSKNLPQVTSDFDLRVNSQLQTNIIPAAFFGPSAHGDKAVQFGTAYNTLWGFTLNQKIYNPADQGDREIAQAQYQYNQLNVKKAETDVRVDVMQAYFTVLLWSEKDKINKDNEKRTHQIFTTAETQSSQGTITPYDAQKAKIDWENALAEVHKSQNNFQLAIKDLYYKMGEDSIQTTQLNDDIPALYQQYKDLETAKQPDLKRVELDLEKTQFQIYQLNIHKQNLTYIPTVTAYANYTLQDISNSSPFASNAWYPFNYFGLKASIPLFDGLLKERTKEEYKLRSQVSKSTLDKLTKDYNQDIANAIATLRNAKEDLDYQEKNRALIEQLYKIDTDHLKNGTIKPNDLATTYYTLQQTQLNYLNAIYNYLVAVVSYKKATGIF